MEYWFLYFIQNCHTKHIKIGYARNITNRLYQMQTDNAHQLTLLGSARFTNRRAVLKTEKHLHKLFNSQLVRGEWFSSTPELEEIARTAA